ncbi:glutathione S-transferase N-terminal domain-containing protein [Allohahella marinimesophila]|uniref:Glutathione S-transferase n=1 Tax=Allohahella marinimesophila TaxID=1054972 RepID=A0ABP7P8Y1_9GAMM
MMQVIGSYTSPFVRKVRVALIEHGLPFDFREETPYTADTPVRDFNPLVKVPAFVDANGETWFDSALILAVLETQKAEGGASLLPSDAVPQLQVRRLETLADGIGDAGVLMFMEKKRDESEQSASWIARQQEKVDNGFAFFERYLTERLDKDFLHDFDGGLGLSAADIALVCVLEWYTLRFNADWRKQYPRLAEYAKQIGGRESFVTTRPPGG